MILCIAYAATDSSCFAQKNEAQHSLRPVTVGQLRKATQAHTDAEWMIENDEIGQVCDLVCRNLIVIYSCCR
jgi:hypothetical protein